MQSEQIINRIRQRESVAVLVVDSNDSLCMRASKMLLIHEGRLRSMGFHVAILDLSARTQSSDELSCVRIPQLRFFVRGKLFHKIVGIFDEAVLEDALKVLV